jgi:hypothetical protein
MDQNQDIPPSSYIHPFSFSQTETLIEVKPPLYFDPYTIFNERIKAIEQNIEIYKSVITELRERISKLEERLTQAGEQQILPIQFLESEKLQLKQPIVASLNYSPEGGNWVVDCPELNLYGEGEDENQAIKDFKVVLEEFYFGLKKDKEKLGPELKQKWDILQQIVQEK